MTVTPQCPHCRTDLHEVRAAAWPGYFLALDQCPRCGGIWCDRWEAFPLTPEAVDGLDPVDAPALRRTCPLTQGQLRCPRCRARMPRFRDPNLPEDACIGRCLNCDGMWFNRGELRRLKRRRGEGRPRTKLDDTTVEALSHAARQTPTVTNLDAAVRPPFPAAVGGAAHEVQGEIAEAAGWLLVRLLLRLLLGL